MVDFFIIVGIMLGISSALNKTVFKTKPASKITAWILTVIVFWLAAIVYLAATKDTFVGSHHINTGVFVGSWYFFKSIQHKDVSDSLKITSKRGNFVGIGIGMLVLWFLILPETINGTLSSQYYISAAFWVGVVIYCSINLTKQTDNKLKNEKHHDNSKVDSTNNEPQAVNNGLFSDEKYYAFALKEIGANKVSSGLWGKALAYADGDQGKAKSFYIDSRAKQLMQLHQEKLNKSSQAFPSIQNKETATRSFMDIAVPTILYGGIFFEILRFMWK